MVFECPKCKTTHSKPEREIGSGAQVSCRNCSHVFSVTATGAVLDEVDERFDDPTAQEGPSDGPDVSEFHQAATEVRRAPPAAAKAFRDSIGAGESAGFEANETAQTSSAEVQERLAEARRFSEESEPVDDPFDAPGSSGPAAPPNRDFYDDAVTEVMKVNELRAMVGEEAAAPPPASERPFADANEEPTTKRPANPDLAASRPTENVSDLPNGLLTSTDPEVDSGVDLGAVAIDSTEMSEDMGRPVPLDDERPDLRGMPSLSGGSGAAVPWPAFPTVALREYFVGLGQFVSAQSPPVKIIMISAVLVIIILVVVLIAFSGGDAKTVFAAENQSLMAGPGPDAIYTKVSDIQRGDELIAFADGAMGEYLLVRDVMGQAGYIQRSSVSEHRPISLPGIPFAGCRHSPLELLVAPCRLRAQTQFESCRTVCDDETDPQTCLDHCQKQLLACIGGCEGESAELAEVPSASPTLEEPIEKSALESPVANEEPSSRPVVKRQPKGKKKRHKKKRRR
ncbi:MAG: hypothetical protein V3T05_08640 [Myxococcota bacterium]